MASKHRPRALRMRSVVTLASVLLTGCFVEHCEWTPGADAPDAPADALERDASTIEEEE